MAELVSQDRPGAQHDTAAQDEHAGHSPTAAVQTMIARGRRSPDELAGVLRRFPSAQREILGFLQATLGNGFVQAVMALVQGPRTADPAVAPAVADHPADARPAGARASKLPLGPVRVTAHGLRVRRTPDATGQDNILGGLGHHAEITALAHEGEWLRIDYHGETAFVHGDYVEPITRPAGGHTGDAATTTAAKPAVPHDAGHGVAPVPTHVADHAADPVAVAEPVASHEHAKPTPEPVAQPKPPVAHAPPTPPVATPKAPEPTKPVDDKHVAPVKQDTAARPEPAAEQPAKPAALSEMFARVYTTNVKGKPHHTQVFVSPGTVSATPNVAVYFHGFEAQYKIGDQGAGVLSGIDVAAEAMAQAKNKNTVAILPQGNIGRNEEHGGHMAVLEGGLPAFLTSILTPLAADLHLDALAPGHISLSGHSAGGYEGMYSALHGAGSLVDAITDVTLMDSNYSEAHFHEAVKWMFHGKPATPAKSLRIVEQASQLAATTKAKPGDKHKPHVNYHDQYFKPGNLDALAKQHGCTVQHVYVESPDAAADVRGKTNTVVQRSKVMKDGAVQADVLIMRSSLHHQELRDSVLDDQLLSVGEGEAANDSFGGHETVVKDALKQARAQGAGTAAAPAKEAPVAKPDAAAKQVTGHATAPSAEHAKPDAKATEHQAPDHELDEHPTHVDGNTTTPEKPKAKPSTTPAKAAGKEVYREGGVLSKEHLHQYSLSDAEFEFKGRVYDAAVARLGDKIYGGVPKDQLKPCGNGQVIREDVLGPLTSMLDAMRAAIAAGTKVNGVEVGKATGISVTSGYRSPEHDRDLWDSYFQKYLAHTAEERAATGDPFGDKAVKLMVHYIGQRKAPPGGSNHSNGIAVDLSMEMNGKRVGNNYDDQHVWKGSWHFAWLEANAASFGFKNYPKEHWHWDYKP